MLLKLALGGQPFAFLRAGGETGSFLQIAMCHRKFEAMSQHKVRQFLGVHQVTGADDPQKSAIRHSGELSSTVSAAEHRRPMRSSRRTMNRATLDDILVRVVKHTVWVGGVGREIFGRAENLISALAGDYSLRPPLLEAIWAYGVLHSTYSMSQRVSRWNRGPNAHH